MPTLISICIDPVATAAICRENYATRLSLFGSILTPHFRPDSNVNILVEFHAEHVPDYFTLLRMQYELADLIQREVDIRTPSEIPAYDRARLLANAHLLHSE